MQSRCLAFTKRVAHRKLLVELIYRGCRAASYSTMLRATPAFNDSTCGACGIAISSSACAIKCEEDPSPSDENRRKFRQSCLIKRSECAQLGEDIETFMREAANRPLERVGIADDIAKAALFLASPMSPWITGIALVADSRSAGEGDCGTARAYVSEESHKGIVRAEQHVVQGG